MLKNWRPKVHNQPLTGRPINSFLRKETVFQSSSREPFLCIISDSKDMSFFYISCRLWLATTTHEWLVQWKSNKVSKCDQIQMQQRL